MFGRYCLKRKAANRKEWDTPPGHTGSHPKEDTLVNPFGLLPPFGLNDRHQLLAEARARMLREEWLIANAGPRPSRPGTLTRIRSRVGRSMVRLGERLDSAARQPQTGC
jgi:hypothetical protein